MKTIVPFTANEIGVVIAALLAVKRSYENTRGGRKDIADPKSDYHAIVRVLEKVRTGLPPVEQQELDAAMAERKERA